MSSDTLGAVLLILARNAIARKLGQPQQPVPESDLPELEQSGATFVTLTQDGDLRGCIGCLEAYRPLRVDVQDNAVSAAFHDPRFAPLATEEFSRTRVEVSLLTPARPLPVADEADALAQLVPFEDGVIFQLGQRRATFLPQVWEELPEPRKFLAHLKQKAGLPASFWSKEVRLFRYGVQKWKEARP